MQYSQNKYWENQQPIFGILAASVVFIFLFSESNCDMFLLSAGGSQKPYIEMAKALMAFKQACFAQLFRKICCIIGVA